MTPRSCLNGRHTVPHDPQLLSSKFRSTHGPPHQARFGLESLGSGLTQHAPSMHVSCTDGSLHGEHASPQMQTGPIPCGVSPAGASVALPLCSEPHEIAARGTSSATETRARVRYLKVDMFVTLHVIHALERRRKSLERIDARRRGRSASWRREVLPSALGSNVRTSCTRLSLTMNSARTHGNRIPCAPPPRQRAEEQWRPGVQCAPREVRDRGAGSSRGVRRLDGDAHPRHRLRRAVRRARARRHRTTPERPISAFADRCNPCVPGRSRSVSAHGPDTIEGRGRAGCDMSKDVRKAARARARA